MLTRFGDFDSALAMFDQLRRRMDRLWEDFDSTYAYGDYQGGLPTSLSAASAAAWPLVNVYDAGANLVVLADVPGLNEKTIQLQISDGTLSLSGERKVDVPKGYSVHRQERLAVAFSRSFALPSKVDAERIKASVKDGVLSITLPKAAEAQPRQITVRAN
ncbi:MAG TPA: Hsp20/alpha crystallin family protein [Polyangiaceae bacterium]|jgi:HSP20 family protein|nr:Hsp20/alpha crystallin family protein [Polyangiaceae bacterium]